MLIDKKNIPIVAMDFMNEVHFEDVDIINNIFELILKYEQKKDEKTIKLIKENYEKWCEHTVNHFKNEEIKMQEKGFSAYLFHKAEHDRTLNKMNEVFLKWEQTNDIDILKNYFSKELIEWLINHINSMDTVTAIFLKTGLSPCAIRN